MHYHLCKFEQLKHLFLLLTSLLKGISMLSYAIIFFVIAVIAGMLGFKGVESGASKIAKIFFFIFIILALLVVGATVLGLKLAF